jgi:hypothetical protein
MHLYGPDDAGGYKEIAGTFQLGPLPFVMGGLLVADYDGDGCDEIIMEVSALKEIFNAECAENAQRTAEVAVLVAQN